MLFLETITLNLISNELNWIHLTFLKLPFEWFNIQLNFDSVQLNQLISLCFNYILKTHINFDYISKKITLNLISITLSFFKYYFSSVMSLLVSWSVVTFQSFDESKETYYRLSVVFKWQIFEDFELFCWNFGF